MRGQERVVLIIGRQIRVAEPAHAIERRVERGRARVPLAQHEAISPAREPFGKGT